MIREFASSAESMRSGIRRVRGSRDARSRRAGTAGPPARGAWSRGRGPGCGRSSRRRPPARRAGRPARRRWGRWRRPPGPPGRRRRRSRTVKQSGQWSRPPAGFTRGVRPNSARLQTSVASSIPRWSRSSIERRVGLVVHRADDVPHPLDRGERLRAVDVPGDLVEHGQEGVDRHEPHAALDQPPGQQAALAESGHPVALAGRRRLAGQVERLAGLRARHQAEGRLEVAVEEGGVLGGLEGGDGVVHELADLPPAIEPDACRSPWAAGGRGRGSRASTGRR